MQGHPANRQRNIAAMRAAGADPGEGQWPGDPGYAGPIAETGDGRLVYASHVESDAEREARELARPRVSRDSADEALREELAQLADEAHEALERCTCEESALAYAPLFVRVFSPRWRKAQRALCVKRARALASLRETHERLRRCEARIARREERDAHERQRAARAVREREARESWRRYRERAELRALENEARAQREHAARSADPCPSRGGASCEDCTGDATEQTLCERAGSLAQLAERKAQICAEREGCEGCAWESEANCDDALERACEIRRERIHGRSDAERHPTLEAMGAYSFAEREAKRDEERAQSEHERAIDATARELRAERARERLVTEKSYEALAELRDAAGVVDRVGEWTERRIARRELARAERDARRDARRAERDAERAPTAQALEKRRERDARRLARRRERDARERERASDPGARS